jgi:WD40 repeat protein
VLRKISEMKKQKIFSTALYSIIWLLTLFAWIPPNANAQADGDVISVAWSPDGTRIVGGGTDGLLRIWDTEGQKVLDITGLTGFVRSVDWSPDGTKIVSGGDDETIRVWDSYNGELLATLVGHQDGIQGVDWSPDGSMIAGASFNDLENLRVWDANTYQQIAIHSSATLSDVFWSPDSTKLIAAASNGFLLIYNVNLGDPTGPSAIDGGYLTARWSPDGAKIAGGDSNGLIHIWDAFTYEPLSTLTGHTDGVHAIAFSPNSENLASASNDGTIRIWDVATGETIATFPKPVIFTTSISWSPDGCRLAFGGENGIVEIVDVFQDDAGECGQNVDSGGEAEPPIYSLAWSLDGSKIAVGRGGAPFVQIIDASTLTIIKDLSTISGTVFSLDWNQDGTKLAEVTIYGGHVWDVGTWEVVTSIPLTRLASVGWSPDGTKLAVSLIDDSVGIISAINGQVLSPMPSAGLFFDWSPDGTKLVSGSGYSNDIYISDIAAQERIMTLTGHTSGIETLDWSPDGTKIASGSNDNTVKIWDAATGELLLTKSTHTALVTAVAWRFDSIILASASSDGTIQIWDAVTGQELNTIQANDDLNALAWSPAGCSVAYAGDEVGVEIVEVFQDDNGVCE